MLSRIHQKLGTAGFIISIVALVAALGGGAWAANGGLTGKQKKEVEKIAKKYAGKPGANGTNGAPGAGGPAGAKGDAGATGAEGKQGPEGKQGKEGSPWTAGGVLPAGKTETGTWAFTTPAPQNAVKIPISFSIPLAKPLDGAHVHLVSADGSSELVLNETTFVLEEVTPTGCGVALTPAGTAEAPKAAPGNLCVYFTEITPRPNAVPPSETSSNYIIPPGAVCEAVGCLPEFGGPGAGAGVSGARLEINSTDTGTRFGYGTWAVTG
jgi:Collagen triple helix repeat (20 copies)